MSIDNPNTTAPSNEASVSPEAVNKGKVPVKRVRRLILGSSFLSTSLTSIVSLLGRRETLRSKFFMFSFYKFRFGLTEHIIPFRNRSLRLKGRRPITSPLSIHWLDLRLVRSPSSKSFYSCLTTLLIARQSTLLFRSSESWSIASGRHPRVGSFDRSRPHRSPFGWGFTVSY